MPLPESLTGVCHSPNDFTWYLNYTVLAEEYASV